MIEVEYARKSREVYTMKLSTYFKDMYPTRREIIREWNQYVSQFENTCCSECGEDRFIGEFSNGNVLLPSSGQYLKEFTIDGQAFFYCNLCDRIDKFKKERLLFVKHYSFSIWLPFLLR